MRISRLFRSLALTLALVLMTSGAALADPCVLCGKESGTDAYLCTACLLDLLEEDDLTGGMTIAAPVYNTDGTVTLTWQDPAGNAPYTVYYERLEKAPVPFGWTAAEGLRDASITLSRLVPGASYLLTVVDAAGNKIQTPYYAPTPGDGNEIGAAIRIKTLRRSVAGRYSNEVVYSAKDIAADDGYIHGLYLRLSYSVLARNRHYAFCITVEAPGGFADVIFSGTLDLHHGRSQLPVWDLIPLDGYFDMLTNYYGGIPTGEYKVTMHFDGDLVDTKTFLVQE